MSNPRFIITRFTHGAAGKFLSTVLQTSDKIDHWSAIVQQHKNTTLGDKLTLEYTNRSFPIDKSQHQKEEPMVPYNTDLYSTGFQRGNDVSIDQYIKNAKLKNDHSLLACIASNLTANLVFHKPNIPLFCKGSSSVTILVSSDQEKNWLYKTLWSKQFTESLSEIRHLPNDPENCNFNILPQVLTYNNDYKFPVQMKSELYDKYVVNDHTNDWYFNPEKFVEHDKLAQLDNIFINLDEVLTSTKFLCAIEKIFNQFNLGTPNMELIQQMHQIWLSRQFPYGV
jgi:hypothetical protein